MFKRINPAAFKKLWCELKHLLVFRELGIEYVSNVARQVTTEEKEVEQNVIKVDAIGNFVGRSEEAIQDLLDLILVDEGVADATWVRVDAEQFRRFLQQVGHIVCCEEHYVDHIKAGCRKLGQTEDQEEKQRIQDEVLQLLVRLDGVRNVRQAYISEFIEPIEEEEVEGKEA